MLLGADVSGANKNVAYSDYDFIIIKASEGNGYKSNALDYHLAEKTNSLYGFYHFARPDLNNTAKEEAEYFLSLVGDYAGNCIYALDWEAEALAYNPDWALAWLNYVYNKTGVKPMLYISASQENTGKYNAIRDADFGLWVAHWGVKTPSVKHWPFWAMWQFDNNKIDKNYFNGNETQFKKYCGSNVSHETISPGDTVKLTSRIDYNGHLNDSWVLNATFFVKSINGRRVVVGPKDGITGAWDITNILKEE